MARAIQQVPRSPVVPQACSMGTMYQPQGGLKARSAGYILVRGMKHRLQGSWAVSNTHLPISHVQGVCEVFHGHYYPGVGPCSRPGSS